MTIDEFVKLEIVNINKGINNFKEGKLYNSTDIKNYLQEKFKTEILNEKCKSELLSDLKSIDYVKSKIEDIANKHIFYKEHLKDFFQGSIFAKIFTNIDTKELTEVVIDNIIKRKDINSREFDFIAKDLRSIINKTFLLATQGGFSSDLQSSEMGLRVANEGDSAQFLFIARAILAGFNCSNVDVRSSRYDAIIDYNSRLLRVQIKGISANNNISFFDRDRGGQGIDHTHERNRGKRITSKDCDIYVAVDKQVGFCYIIPMSFADSLDENIARNIKLENLKNYFENWNIIKDVSSSLGQTSG